MTHVQISPAVEIQELLAIEASQRNRILILAQAVSDQRAALAERDGQIAELKEQLARLEKTETPTDEGDAGWR